jgi:hypothetical protein
MQSHPEDYDVVVLGSGEAGKYIAWALAVTFLSAVADRFGLWGPSGGNGSLDISRPLGKELGTLGACRKV